MSNTAHNRDSYGVGIVCALPIEKAAVIGMLDEEHTKLRSVEGDTNDYTFGKIGQHNIVVACLPAGGTGKVSTATVAANMMRSFSIRIGLMVGIGGGVPSKSRDIRLGDVVVSQPAEQHGGVVQWDFGKMEKGGGFRRTGTLNKPPAVLLKALAGLQARHEGEEPEMRRHVAEMLARKPRMAKQNYIHQGRENDWLFEADYDHPDEETCDACDKDRLVRRPDREDEKEIVVHAGNIASGDEVMKDGLTRDRIAASEKVICFEMEAAGLMDNFQCLVIRGICDYADSHKHKRWQRYAAAAAAAYAKELLLTIPVAEVGKTQRMEETVERIHNLPFSENHDFVGRRDELAQLEQKFFGPVCRRQVAVVGLGGIGKTQVALSFAYRVWKAHAGFSVFWIPAVSAETAEKAFKDIAEKLGLPAPSDDETSVSQMVCRHLASPRAGSWLLVIDNADETSVTDGDARSAGLLRQLPRSDRGLTLITTRRTSIAQSFAGSDMVEIGQPSKRDASAMLRRAVKDEAAFDDRTAVTQLLEELDDLPLALTQAAAYINVNRIRLSDYLNILRSTEEDVVEIMSTEIADKTRYEGSDNAIARTWVVSFQQIRDRDAHAAVLLRYISCIEWKAIPESILPPAETKAGMTNAVGLLCSYLFLSRRGKEKMYDMHRLVHLATRVWDEKYGRPTDTRAEAILHLAVIFPFGEHEKREIWRAYLPHVARINRDSAGIKVDWRGELCIRVGYCLWVDGRLEEAMSWLRDSTECFDDVAEEDAGRLSAQHHLAIAYEANGHVEEAVALLEHVVAVREKVLAEDHPSRLTSQHELARACKANGQVKKAVALLEHVVAVQEKVLAEDHPDRLASQHELARAYLTNGRIREAVALLEHVVAVRGVLAEDHPDRLSSQHTLAGASLVNGQVKEAVALLEHVVAVREVLAEDHPSRLTSQHELARAYEANGQVKKAVALLDYVVAVREVLAEDHPDRLTSQGQLALAYRADGQRQRAVRLMEHVVDIQEKKHQQDHPSRLASEGWLRIWHEQDVEFGTE